MYTTGPPKILTHDQGSEMKGNFEAVEEQFGFKVIKSSAYHPEGNGKAEAGIKKLKSKLLMFLESTCNIDGDWDQLPLIKAVHSINTTVSTLHGVTPMEVVLGRPANEKSVLVATNMEKQCIATEPGQTNLNEKEADSRKLMGKTIHKVIERGQRRQIRSYRKK